MAERCIYKSIVLTEGETFVLPPGAILVSATDPAAITSSCPSPIPTAVLKCYRIHWTINFDEEGTYFYGLGNITVNDRENAWEQGDDDEQDIMWDKIGALGSEIDASSINLKDLAGLENIMGTSAIAGAISGRKYTYNKVRGNLLIPGSISGDAKTGYDYYDFYFRTTEELAKMFYLEVGQGGNNIASKTRLYPIEIDCGDYDGVTTQVASCDDTVVVNPNDPV